MTQEVSISGKPIIRHTERTQEQKLAIANEQNLNAISEHVEKYIGKIDNVIHEIISDLVHLDILVVHPTVERNYYTFITCGMSNLPMTVPEGADNYKYAELMLCLPSDWNVSQDAFDNEDNYWPIYWLKTMARLPHEYETWLYLGHTVPNGEPAEPFASNTEFSGMILAIPSVVENVDGFFTLNLPNSNEIHFFSLLPLYKDEMDLKLNKGAEILYEKLNKAGVNDVINLKRSNVAKKRFLFF